MPITSLVKDFGSILDITTRFRSDVYQLNAHLIDRDPLLTASDYLKVKNAFKELKAAMIDTERAVDKIIKDGPPLADLFP